MERGTVMDMVDTVAMWLTYIGAVLMFAGIMLMLMSNCM